MSAARIAATLGVYRHAGSVSFNPVEAKSRRSSVMIGTGDADSSLFRISGENQRASRTSLPIPPLSRFCWSRDHRRRAVDAGPARPMSPCCLPAGAPRPGPDGGLAPTTSTNDEMTLGDALAICAARNAKASLRQIFQRFHPGREDSGRRLLRVPRYQCMSGMKIPLVSSAACNVRGEFLMMTAKELRACAGICRSTGERLIGVITGRRFGRPAQWAEAPARQERSQEVIAPPPRKRSRSSGAGGWTHWAS